MAPPAKTVTELSAALEKIRKNRTAPDAPEKFAKLWDDFAPMPIRTGSSVGQSSATDNVGMRAVTEKHGGRGVDKVTCDIPGTANMPNKDRTCLKDSDWAQSLEVQSSIARPLERIATALEELNRQFEVFLELYRPEDGADKDSDEDWVASDEVNEVDGADGKDSESDEAMSTASSEDP